MKYHAIFREIGELQSINVSVCVIHRLKMMKKERLILFICDDYSDSSELVGPLFPKPHGDSLIFNYGMVIANDKK